MKYFTPQGIITILLLLTVLFISNKTFADTLYIGALSHHTHKTEAIKREKHPLLIYEKDGGLMVGYFKNSFDKDAFILGYHLYFVREISKDTPDVNIGIKAGLTTGYSVPVFAILNAQVGYLDFNMIPTKLITVGLKFDF